MKQSFITYNFHFYFPKVEIIDCSSIHSMLLNDCVYQQK